METTRVASIFAAIGLCAGCTTSLDDTAAISQAHAAPISLTPIGTYSSGIFDAGAAEILDYDARTERLFVVNTAEARIDAIDISDPSSPTLAFTIDVSAFGPRASSVAVSSRKRLVVAVIPNAVAQQPGVAALYTTDGVFKRSVVIGPNPDKVTFTHNGTYILAANEGVPSDDYTVDPEGSVSVIRVRGRNIRQSDVRTADFQAFNGASLDPSVRIYGPGASVAQDLEPEHVTISHNDRTAWVTLQENNAVAVVDIRSATVTDIVGLGFKDHSLAGQGLDPSNRDSGIQIGNWPVNGMYQPDSIASFRVRGKTFLITANEGDARDYDGFSEEVRLGSLTLDPTAFPNAAALQDDAALGRLRVTDATGDIDQDGDLDAIYSYGARSFSIWTAAGELVFDSGDELEQITAAAFPADFNSTNDENDSFDSRSDDKGPEPEGVAVGKIGRNTYAFVALERISGVVVYDVSDPYAPVFEEYVNPRDFSGDAEAGTAGDLGPEDLVFISRRDSPTRRPLLAVANEISGTTTIYEINGGR